jgi:hypothetical protein
VPKNESFSSYLKDLNLSKFSDIWTINKIHNKFLAHDLKRPFKAIFNAAKRDTPPALEDLYLPKIVCLFYIA